MLNIVIEIPKSSAGLTKLFFDQKAHIKLIITRHLGINFSFDNPPGLSLFFAVTGWKLTKD